MANAARSRRLLGTHVEVKLREEDSGQFPACFNEIQRIERAFSRFLDDSELSRLNSNIGAWQDASPEMVLLVAKALQLYKDTGGLFDITVKETLDSLGYDKEYSFTRKPLLKRGLLHAIRKSVEGNVALDTKTGRILLNKQIDFGGFGKGYALDSVAKLLESRGVTHYYVNAGGDIIARRGEGQPEWIILLEHPDDTSRVIGKIPLDGSAIAASAPNRRKWGDGLHHLIDPRTGKPATGVKSTFVIARQGVDADAYATALFAAGFAGSIALCAKLPIEALVISSEDKLFYTRGFAAEFFDS